MFPTLIYLHGFLSSPQSVKAQQTLAYAKQNYPNVNVLIPQLSNYPKQAAEQIYALIEQQSNNLRFIGSSMGGFMTTHMLEKFGGKGVLINPAVRPHELLADFLGEQVNPYTQEKFTLKQQHIQELVELNTECVKQQNDYLVMLQTGDETLDYRKAVALYEESNLLIETGGDHSFQNYEKHLPDIFNFLFQDTCEALSSSN